MPKPLSGDLSDRVVLVTGAAQGVGGAIARRAAQWGATVLLTDRNADAGEQATEALRQEGARAAFVPADLADPDAPARVMAACDAAFGRIDALVNAAALTDRCGWAECDVAFWDRMFAVNARAPFLLMQAAVKRMRRDRIAGAIVNILTVNALCGRPELPAYSASKGALATLTRNAANAFLADRIRVNGINLGWVETPNEDVVQRRSSPHGADWLAHAKANMPFGRLITPDEVADLAAFLISPHSGVMTGALVDYNQAVVGALHTPGGPLSPDALRRPLQRPGEA
jgi:NAD(P)-dependent dehydrogenase (short-subunit alcohol dehydrogenase family)